ncbi:MAG: hypothetical protein WBE41_21030 [Terracidiphilus sp.]
MNDMLLTLIAGFALSAPLLAIAFLLFQYCWRRAAWRHRRRKGARCAGFCPSACAMGVALLFMQVFYRPTVMNVIEVIEHEDTEEDDQGNPENLRKQLNRQLKRIRRGEPVGDLVLRL